MKNLFKVALTLAALAAAGSAPAFAMSAGTDNGYSVGYGQVPSSLGPVDRFGAGSQR